MTSPSHSHSSTTSFKRGTMRRSGGESRASMLFIAILCIVCVVLIYNYYNVSTERNMMREDVQLFRLKQKTIEQEKKELNIKNEALIGELSTVKQSQESTTEKLKELQQELTKVSDLMKQKESEAQEALQASQAEVEKLKAGKADEESETKRQLDAAVQERNKYKEDLDQCNRDASSLRQQLQTTENKHPEPRQLQNNDVVATNNNSRKIGVDVNNENEQAKMPDRWKQHMDNARNRSDKADELPDLSKSPSKTAAAEVVNANNNNNRPIEQLDNKQEVDDHDTNRENKDTLPVPNNDDVVGPRFRDNAAEADDTNNNNNNDNEKGVTFNRSPDAALRNRESIGFQRQKDNNNRNNNDVPADSVVFNRGELPDAKKEFADFDTPQAKNPP